MTPPPPPFTQEEDALAHVAGFTVANDVSARDWQMRRNGKQWLLGKTFDSFCPLGPALVTRDAVGGERRLCGDSQYYDAHVVIFYIVETSTQNTYINLQVCTIGCTTTL